MTKQAILPPVNWRYFIAPSVLFRVDVICRRSQYWSINFFVFCVIVSKIFRPHCKFISADGRWISIVGLGILYLQPARFCAVPAAFRESFVPVAVYKYCSPPIATSTSRHISVFEASPDHLTSIWLRKIPYRLPSIPDPYEFICMLFTQLLCICIFFPSQICIWYIWRFF